MAKKAMAFRLSDAARERLAELAKSDGVTATAVIERLIGLGRSLKAPGFYGSPGEGPPAPKPVNEKYDPRKPRKAAPSDMLLAKDRWKR